MGGVCSGKEKAEKSTSLEHRVRRLTILENVCAPFTVNKIMFVVVEK